MIQPGQVYKRTPEMPSGPLGYRSSLSADVFTTAGYVNSGDVVLLIAANVKALGRTNWACVLTSTNIGWLEFVDINWTLVC